VIYGGDDWGLYRLYFALYTLFAVGFIGISLSTNLIELYLFIELVLIPSYFLLDLFGYGDRHRVAIMCFIWSHIGAALFLIGVVLAYVKTGSFEVSTLSSLTGTYISGMLLHTHRLAGQDSGIRIPCMGSMGLRRIPDMRRAGRGYNRRIR